MIIPNDILHDIFVWVNPQSISKYMTLSKAVHQVLTSYWFAVSNLERHLPNSMKGKGSFDLVYRHMWQHLPDTHQQVYYDIYTDAGKAAELQVWARRYQVVGGHIPTQLANLVSLKQVCFFRTSLRGCIPCTLGKLANLVELDLADNDVVGVIPKELGFLGNLAILKLCSNNLCGSIPEELGFLVSLEVLNVSGNKLTGKIPETLCNLTQLQELHLGYNMLTGGIPSGLGGLLQLKSATLMQNRLTGSVPKQLGDLPNIVQLDNKPQPIKRGSSI
ncbi:hypothetical protein BDR26DRAFT_861953 [Obelidium mucronatum]|nr:hypothetical protein BDR26DRAFT_861953 [Obelidium mucronatum]